MSTKKGHAKGTFVLSQCLIANRDNQANQELRRTVFLPALPLGKPGVAFLAQCPEMFFCPTSVWPSSCALPRRGQIDLKPVSSGENESLSASPGLTHS